MSKDLALALHFAGKRPASSLAIVSILAFGIAGVTAMFSVFNGLFLRPLPFPDPGRLMDVDETAPQWDLDFVSVAYPDFEAFRDENRSFEALAAYEEDDVNLFLRGESPRRVRTARVTHDLNRVLSIELVLGRNFTPEEDRPGAPKVALLGHALWREQFGGAEDVLGESVVLDGEPHTVIGVLPPEAVFIGDAELFVALATDASVSPGSWYLNSIGRLRPDATPESARADLLRIHRSRIESRPLNEITSPVVNPVLDRILGEYRSGTAALLAAVLTVLVMVCANVSGLMLARSASRRREMGIRLALGASRGRIARLVLAESFLLAAAGGALGIALGHGALRYLLAHLPEEVPKFLRFEIDGTFLLASLSLLVGSAVLSGLAPAMSASRTDANHALRESGRSVSASARTRLRLGMLVVAELTLAAVLLVGAGVLLESFREIARVDPGFRPEGVLTYRISLPRESYEEDEDRIVFFERHLERTRAFPGVLAAGAVSAAPLGSHEGWFFEAEGAAPRAPDAENPVVLLRVATPGYFDALGITLHSGRFFDENDGRDPKAGVAIVNEEIAGRFWPGMDALGRRIRAGDENPWLTVVGVVRDVKHYGLQTAMRPGVYLPYRGSTRREMTVALRTGSDPEALAPLAREAVRELDPTLPIFQVVSMSRRLQESLWIRRTSSWLVSVFAAFALALAVAGIYGVISHAANERTREIAIRMALGARRSQVLASVLKQGGILIAVGITLGTISALAAGRLLSSFLFQVSATDLRVYALVIGILIASGFLANWFPARRACAIDPMESLRAD
jgi:predicted permease